MQQAKGTDVRIGPGPSFSTALREHPVRRLATLTGEYGMFASGLGLAAGLFVTRVPLRLLDHALGTRLRERFVDLVARISPG